MWCTATHRDPSQKPFSYPEIQNKREAEPQLPLEAHLSQWQLGFWLAELPVTARHHYLTVGFQLMQG